MMMWPAGRRRSALLVSAVLLLAAPLPAVAEDATAEPAIEVVEAEVAEPAAAPVEVVESEVMEPAAAMQAVTTAALPAETSEPTPTTDPTSDPSPTTEPEPDPTVTETATPTPDPTETATPTPDPTETSTPTPEPTETSTPTPEPTETASPSPSPSPSPETAATPIVTSSPTTSAPTVTSPTVTTSPTTSGVTAAPSPTLLSTFTGDVTTRATTSTVVQPTSRTSITTGGGEMMAALIKINTAEARCQADPTAVLPVVRINSEAVPAAVGPFFDDQIINAAIVMSAGLEMGVPERAIVIAVMTAMGESGLRVVDEGEAIGPDNAGLFQQGAGSTWGSHEDRADPKTSATSFYRELLAIDGWETLEPADAANAVQKGADAAIYGEFWDEATEMVTSLSETAAVTARVEPCVTELGALGAGSGAWVSPVVGRATSSFGYRVHPVLGIAGAHTGTDIAAKCGTPVVAARDGIVVWSGGGIQGRTGNQVVIYHGDGELTRYGHLLSGSVLVTVGTTVKAGDRVASVGGDRRLDPLGAGNSTGCHLHFETNANNGGTALDPVATMREHGVTLGAR